MMFMPKKRHPNKHIIQRKTNIFPNRIVNRSSSSLNMLKAVTMLATMSTLSEGFMPNPSPCGGISSPCTNTLPSSSNAYGLHQSLRSPSQCEMVMMDVDTVLGETNFNKRTQSKEDEDFSMASMPKVSGYRTDGVRAPLSKRSQQKQAAATLELVGKKLKVSKRKDRKKTSPNKTKSTTFQKQISIDKGKSPKLQLVAPTKQRMVRKQKQGVTEDEDVDPILSSIMSESINKEKTKKTKSRSSTMPGLAYSNTMRMKAYQDGLDIVEQKSGRSIRHTHAIESKRKAVRKSNSEQMYGQSVSVPDSLIQFVGEIHQESRITPQEEKDLGSKTQEAIRLQNLYEDLGDKLNREPTDAEYCAAAGKINMEALRQTIEEGLVAKNRLVTSNLRMVQRVVNLYLRNGLGSEYNAGDLMQDGTVALIRAAEKFEPQRGFRFSTYAMYWIRSSVKRSQILQSRVIDVPQRLHEHYKKIQKFQKEHIDSFGCEPELKDIAEAVNLSELQVERCIKALEQRIYSLDAEITNPMKTGGGNTKKETMYNLIQNKLDDVETDTIERHFMKEDLIRSLRKHLSPHEVDLLLLRYGLIDEKTLPHGFSGPLTITEVSRLVGLKPDKVRRMLNNSLRRLKHVIGNEWERETI